MAARVLSKRPLITALLLGLPILIGWIGFASFHAYAHNDDFLYARCTEILVQEGRYQHVSQHGLLAASVVSHCLWGALVCWPFGFSYDMLHVSVGLAAWLSAICVFYSAKELGGSESTSFLAALAMLSGPFYYGMSFTFMTDVTASAFASLAVLGYIKGMCRQSMPWLLLGAVGGVLATWARQTHLCVIMIPIVGLLGNGFQSRRFHRSIVTTAIAAGIPLLSFVAFEMGLWVPSNENRVGIVDVDQHDWNWIRQTMLFTYGGGLLLGLVAIPLIPLMIHRVRHETLTNRGWMLVPGFAIAAVWLGLFLASQGRAHLTQATGYILYNAHLGPILLGDQNDPGRWSDIGGVAWPAFVWQTLTVASIAALSLFAARLGADINRIYLLVRHSELVDDYSAQETRTTWASCGLLICLASAAAGLLLYVEMVYDRYWILCYPMLFTYLGSWTRDELTVDEPHRHPSNVTALALSLGFLLGSLVLTHDFLAWNDARHAQVQRWLDQGLEPKDFDAGNGINGWFRSHEDVETHLREGDDTHFWRGLATRALAIGPRDGWTVEKTVPWNSWAGWKTCELFVLSKDPD